MSRKPIEKCWRLLTVEVNGLVLKLDWELPFALVVKITSKIALSIYGAGFYSFPKVQPRYNIAVAHFIYTC